MTNEMTNALIAALNRNDKKAVIEILKDFVERSSFSKEEKEITKTYIDLGHEIFDEVDCIKAEAECVKLCGLLEQYRNKRNKL